MPGANETEEITQSHEGKYKGKEFTLQEEDSVEELKRKLELANFEISSLKKASRKHAIKEAYLTKYKLNGRTKHFKYLRWSTVMFNSIARLSLQ